MSSVQRLHAVEAEFSNFKSDLELMGEQNQTLQAEVLRLQSQLKGADGNLKQGSDNVLCFFHYF